MAVKLLDINLVFQYTRRWLFFAFTPAVIFAGMRANFDSMNLWDIINIID